MDPGTALAIVGLVFDASEQLYDYYRAWKNCDKDVEDLRLQLIWLHSVFRVVREILRNPGLSDDGSNLVYNALGQCNDAANELRNILDQIRKHGSPQNAFDRLKAQGRKACYPFRKSTVLGIAENIETCRDALHLAADLLNLDTTMQNHRQLQVLDESLTDGIANINLALQPLSAIEHNTSSITSMTASIVTNVATVEHSIASFEQRKHKEDTLDWISKADYAIQQNDIIRRRQEGTGKWFLECGEFQAWIQGARKTILCPGNPGAGKTVIAATVVDYLMREKHSPSTAILYLYCDYKRQHEQHTEHLLSALLRQAVYVQFAVLPPVQEMYRRHIKNNTRPSLDELKKLLQATVENFSTVYIVVDALDECQSIARSQLLSFLRELPMRNRVQLLATSRFMPEMYSEVGADCQVEIVATDADVKRYVEGRLIELSRCVQNEVGIQQQVLNIVVEAVKGMFLLARLHIDSLKTKRTIKAVKKALYELPRGSEAYNNTYEDTMHRICCQAGDDRDTALQAIAWITRSKRPLHAVELQHALAIEPGSHNLDADNETSIDEILSLCAGLITIEEQTNIVRLVHYTTQEYLDRTWSKWIPDAESSIGLKCITYLAFTPFSSGPCSSDEELKERFAKHPLYQYCATYWSHHIRAAERSGACEDDTLLKVACQFFLDPVLVHSANQAFSIFRRHRPIDYHGRSQDYPRETLGTHLTAHFNTPVLMKLLLARNCECDSKDEYGSTPLSLAATEGHEGIVRLLIETGQVEIDSKSFHSQTPLSLAADAGHEGVVRLLIETGQVDVNSKAIYDFTPLLLAAIKGHEGVVRLLIETGQVEVNCKTENGQTPLEMAAGEGHEGIVRLLLETGQVEVDSRSIDGETALSAAAQHRHKGIVKLLKEAGASRGRHEG